MKNDLKKILVSGFKEFREFGYAIAEYRMDYRNP